MRPLKELSEGRPAYISLFSGAGIGCHGLSMEGFVCVATVESIARRLEIQRFNNKCISLSGYICGDMNDPGVREKIYAEAKIQGFEKPLSLDAVVATPPCQGMSVCNHKKGDETRRNSLVVSAMEAVGEISPKIFVFENTALFLKTPCELRDGRKMPIGKAVFELLGRNYLVYARKINLKNYGCPSSRTRTLVIGTHKKLGFSPLSIWPQWTREKTLREIIGDLPSLRQMGEIASGDIYHSFKPYAPHMRAWISNLKAGEGAFSQREANRRPHRMVNGARVENRNANGDKYRRQDWNSVPPCVHTRNDILSSQNTVHPKDDRVFSIRELMRMLSVSPNFKWSKFSAKTLSKLPEDTRRQFLRANEMNIRQCLGEAAPPEVMRRIAKKAAAFLVDNKGDGPALSSESGLENFMRKLEIENNKRVEHAAYYTPPSIAFKLMEMIPDLRSQKNIRVLEPSAGIGRLLHLLPKVFADYEKATIDAVDIDATALDSARSIAAKIAAPPHVRINYLCGDFLDYPAAGKYDLVIGNPPFGKLNSAQFRHYVANAPDTGSRNIFSFFLKRALGMARYVVMIIPKSFLNAPEFNRLRSELNAEHTIRHICDFGETGFEGVRIETIAIAIEAHRRQKFSDAVGVESTPFNLNMQQRAGYIFDGELPYWVIYRNEEFDTALNQMNPGVFSSFRDRQICKRHLHKSGAARVLKSRNIAPLQAEFTGDEMYVRNPSDFAVHRFLGRSDVVLVPNLSYAPRACRMPKACVPDGSVAVLYPKKEGSRLNDSQVRFFASDEFRRFYRVARNYATRSLNIDANSVFFFGERVRP